MQLIDEGVRQLLAVTCQPDEPLRVVTAFQLEVRVDRHFSERALRCEPAEPLSRRTPGLEAFTNEERKALTATRSITRDEQGREVLVGLTESETIRYMGYVRRGQVALRKREMHKQLEEKHEYARIEAIGIEHTLEMAIRPGRSAQGGSR